MPTIDCRVPKLFRTYLSSELEVRNMKLNKRKIHWIIREKKNGATTNEIARDMKISTRRVQQVWKQYLDTGIEPAIGEDIGRPKKPYDSKEAQIVVLAYARYRFGAWMLEVAIRKIYKLASLIIVSTCI